jgi:hypothetical protein
MPKNGNSGSGRAAERPATVAVLAGLDNGPATGYLVLATATGTGFSSLAGTALTTWDSPGATGLQFFVRDLDSREVWSPGRPGRDGAARVEARWAPGVFTLEHTGNGVRTRVETCILADRPAELRRVTLTDLSGKARRLDVTSLAEVVLFPKDAHTAHPAFSKLFLQTRHVEEQRALLVSRRPRDPHETHPVLVHAIV